MNISLKTNFSIDFIPFGAFLKYILKWRLKNNEKFANHPLALLQFQRLYADFVKPSKRADVYLIALDSYADLC